jgi:hypothetical protein
MMASMSAFGLCHHDDHRDQFNRGVRERGRGGHSMIPANDDDLQGGIGPGKDALIGGAGRAMLGAMLGVGLKGTIIGGAAAIDCSGHEPTPAYSFAHTNGLDNCPGRLSLRLECSS